MLAVILCGGKSSRMRENKALLPFGEKSLIAHQFFKLNNFFQTFIISKETQSESLFTSIRASSDNSDISRDIFLTESESIFSPLHGIICAFNELKARGFLESKIFFITCDTPFVSAKTMNILSTNARDYDIIYARDSLRHHPLIGVWSAKIQDKLSEILDKNENVKIMDAIARFNTKSIFFNENEFFNINDKKDYKRALEMLDK